MFILNLSDGKEKKLHKAYLNDTIKARHNDFRKLQK